MATIIFRFALLLLVAFLAFSSECCQTYIKLGHSDWECAFHVTYNDTSCHNFIWSHCSYEDGFGNLANIASFSFCTSWCCDMKVVYAQNWDGIRQCQDYLDWKVYFPLILAFSIFGGIPILYVIYRVVTWIKEVCSEQRAEAAPQGSHRQNIAVQSLEIPQPQIVHVQTRWTQNETKCQKFKENCCICLSNEISLELECGHVFHRQCIITWLRNKQVCALCRSNELRTVKIYCEGCFSSFRTSTLLDNLDSLNGNKQLCSNCS